VQFSNLFIHLMIQILTAKLCGKQAKKKLRKITVLHSNVEAIQVERSYWDETGEHVMHPAAIRKKIPLRKKIREKKSKIKGSRSSNKNKSRGPSSSPAESGGGGGGGISANNSKGPPRYGTLWRKKRGERARLSPAAQQSNNNKTDTAATSAALNGDLQSPISPVNQQTFDLVQLQTPPVQQQQVQPSAGSNGRPMYPILEGAATTVPPQEE
jgi:hypothetical protein